MTELNRRQALWLASAGMAALAGCSESSADDPDETVEGDGELPLWASILPSTDQSPYVYGSIDVETMYTVLDADETDGGSEPTDPLLRNPILLCSFGITTLSTAPAVVQFYSNHDETPSGEGVLVYANGVYALLGEYDRDALVTDLEEAGYASETDTESGSIYTDSESGEVVGLTDDVYAFAYPDGDDSAFDPKTAVEDFVTTATGEQEPKHVTDESFERLLRAGESSGISLGLYTTDDELDAATIEGAQQDDTDNLDYAFDAFEGAYGVHQHLSVGDGDAYASAIVEHADEDRVNVDRLESSLGAEADSVDLTREGPTVSIAAEYDGDLS